MRNRHFIPLLLTLLALFSCGKAPAGPEVPEGPAPELPDDDGVLSVLAIGNSFSVDGMEYLYDILKAAGEEKVFLGNLYIGGCSLETHDEHFKADDAAYTYYTNSTGTWNKATNHKPLAALEERDWDIITLQQASGVSGKGDTFDPYLTDLVSIVREKCPEAKLYWHMTWAYQGNSTHSAFPDYGSNQMTMYNAIVNAVRQKVLTKEEFVKVIPSGTAIQNLRTSLYGDTVTRDGHHLSYDAGRFAAALTWAGTLCGTDSQSIDWHPAAYTYSDKQLGAIREAAANAILSPYTVTESSYPPEPVVERQTLEDYIRAAGKDPAGYTKLNIPFTIFAYYNSSNPTMLSTMYTLENPNGQTNLHDFCATPIYTKEDLPSGTLIVVKSGFQYRPEGWITLTTKNSSSTRPQNVTANLTEVNAAWWGSWNYRAFNLLKNPRATLTEADAKEVCASFGIFIKK